MINLLLFASPLFFSAFEECIMHKFNLCKMLPFLTCRIYFYLLPHNLIFAKCQPFWHAVSIFTYYSIIKYLQNVTFFNMPYLFSSITAQINLCKMLPFLTCPIYSQKYHIICTHSANYNPATHTYPRSIFSILFVINYFLNKWFTCPSYHMWQT